MGVLRQRLRQVYRAIGKYRSSKTDSMIAILFCMRSDAVKSDDGFSCDISAVEDAVSWIEAPVCIKSTVIPADY